jgi:hypothetical protein
MKMTKQLFCMTALAALAVSSQGVRADEYVMPDAQQFARYEADAQPMTCAQATAFAWFKQQLELTDGNTNAAVDTPLECGRTYLAKSPDSDDGDK